ncbi:hypothetical protein L6452_17274 [Arctium lappa]|uniref:Uncharacterized protein n=1 Tax=Arctium lappa TaxID=4217 RepID=A0ACB9C336_ARCLA|nr:hypothetical protein L6452_17274 [Arctium lappa]
MERSTRSQTSCFLVCGLVAALLSHNFVLPAASSSSFQDEKNFYFPPIGPGVGSPPVALSPPIVSLTPPIVPSPPIGYGSYGTPPPSHGSGGSTPPVHHTPSHGGGRSSGHGSHHHGGSPPANCGIPTPHHHSPPPKHVDPSPVPPTPSTGGHHNPSPAPPTTGYHYYPPPSSGGGGGTTPSPIVLPPTTPGIPFPSPPFDPNSPPVIGGTCDFWRHHPGIIWGLFGWWGTTIGSAFGVATLPGTGAGTGTGAGIIGPHLNLQEALSNTRTDGIGALYREGTASLLNSMVNKNFPFTTSHVKDSFVAAVGSNKAATAQARVFKLANEGHMKPRV